jgi:2-dehydro-3-deoxy-D-arabinonate dehydratase
MLIIRYALDDQVHIGVRSDEDQVRRLPVDSVAQLLRLPLDDIRTLIQPRAGNVESGPVRALPPIDGLTEVWASGVTYQRSSGARQEESVVAEVYSRVYDARRPELFFKSTAWRVSGDGEPIGIRTDSPIDVPEAELALIINAHREIVGLSVCNDVSSRSIEAENPLYLPQAKFYNGACALGPGIRPIWEIADPSDLAVSVIVTRGDDAIWQADTSTILMHRTFADLVEYLFRAVSFPDGVVLSTGTGAVPELNFALRAGDQVTIAIPGVGTLSNVVRDVTDSAFEWLTPDPARSAG